MPRKKIGISLKELHLSKIILTMPLPLVSGVETSVMMAVPILMFPLLIPPIILAKTNKVKEVESDQTK